jgi:hypothetical protein
MTEEIRRNVFTLLDNVEIHGKATADSSVPTIDRRLAQIDPPQTPADVEEREFLLNLRAKKTG